MGTTTLRKSLKVQIAPQKMIHLFCNISCQIWGFLMWDATIVNSDWKVVTFLFCIISWHMEFLQVLSIGPASFRADVKQQMARWALNLVRNVNINSSIDVFPSYNLAYSSENMLNCAWKKESFSVRPWVWGVGVRIRREQVPNRNHNNDNKLYFYGAFQNQSYNVLHKIQYRTI